MKKTSLIIIVGFAFLLGGCKSLFIPTEEVTETVVRIPATTNIVQTANGPLATITPESTVTNYSTNIIYKPNPIFTTSVTAAKQVNSIANPTPFAPILNIILTIATAAAGLYARKLNGEKVSMEGAAISVIKGVAKASGSDAVKASIKTQSKSDGTKVEIDKLISKHI